MEENMADNDILGRRSYRFDKTRRERTSSKRVKASGCKKRPIRYEFFQNYLVEFSEPAKKLYGILTEEEREIFTFLYLNPLEEIIGEMKELPKEIEVATQGKTQGLLKMRDLYKKAQIYIFLSNKCNSHKELVEEALNYRGENADTINFFFRNKSRYKRKIDSKTVRLTDLLEDSVPNKPKINGAH